MDLSEYDLVLLRDDGAAALYRAQRPANPATVLMSVAGRSAPSATAKLEHEYALASILDAKWAARPLSLLHHEGRPTLILEDFGGEPIARAFDCPTELHQFLRLAINLSAAVGQMHRHGLIHKDIKPANILVDASGNVRLTGFGIASRLPLERQQPAPAEIIAGTFAYMAPEQTGRMNRSIDTRSDLYSLGVTLYEMLTGALPFAASDPMEWIHCHIARRPVEPSERIATIPEPVSGIVMKLLAKTAEDRYQTAGGVEADLRRCLAEWKARQRIDWFPLGAHDASDRLLIPEKLYGREVEIETLRLAFDRVRKTAQTELVLISGYSGIGKSSVVNELHKALVSPRGFFAAGKFDQYKRDIPYATLARSFQLLIRQLLSQSDEEIAEWQRSLTAALGPNAQLIINLIPELGLLIVDPPPVVDLSPRDAQNRFQLAFRQLLGVFATREHPLVLFVDDLQWLDKATLELIEHFATHPEVQHLLIIGAYRDNEVDQSHPLARTLTTLRGAGRVLHDIVLAPLTPGDVGRLVADSLHLDLETAWPLARLVHEKTGGNPFFAIQFMKALADEALLAFDHERGAWTWDMPRIRRKGFTDNIADLMAAKLSNLPDNTRRVLGQLACLGNVAEVARLKLVHGDTDKLHADLWEAVQMGLLFRTSDSYAFLHDRVQEAAYAAIPESERDAMHLRIGRALVAGASPDELSETIFEIANHLNRSTDLITSPDERAQVAELNLIAGKRAKSAAAYDSALRYLAAGARATPADAWERRYDLIFALEINRAECEFLNGNVAAAEERLSRLAPRASNLVDGATVTRLLLDLYTTSDRSSRAVAVCLDYLRQVGIDWSPHPKHEKVIEEYQNVWQRLGDRVIEDLVDLPANTDLVCRVTLDVLASLQAPARFADENLPRLIAARMVNLSLLHGNSDGSPLAYVWFGQFLTHLEEYERGFRFGKVGIDLIEKHGMDRFKARVYLTFGHSISPWNSPVRTGLQYLRLAFDTAQKTGDLTFASYASNSTITLLLAAGAPLHSLQQEAEYAVAFIRKARFGIVTAMATSALKLIQTLRGLTNRFGFFDDTEFDESAFEQHVENNPQLAIAACWYWTRKLQARFLGCEWEAAVDAAQRSARLYWTSQSNVEEGESRYYAALAMAAHHDSVSADQQAGYLAILSDCQRYLDKLARNCPENFASRASLVRAEIARIAGNDLDAQRAYDSAIRSAHDHGLIVEEAVSYELAARFYTQRGIATIADACLRRARSCYVRWGADGKVRQLDQLYAQLKQEWSTSDSSLATSVEQLDVATIVKVSQAVSSEIDLRKLIDTLMTAALEHTGADRGLLVLRRGESFKIEAEAKTAPDTVDIHFAQPRNISSELPETMLRYVIRTQDIVLLDDASGHNPYSGDDYFRRSACRSVLCLPLIKQAALIGVLYLENSLSSHVFTPARIAVLRLLASQAAISLENAHLFADLQFAEANLTEAQRLSHTGSFGWTVSTGEFFWSEECFKIFGYDTATKPALGMVLARVHPDDVALVRRTIDQAAETKQGFDFEHRLLMPDGSVKHLHVVAHAVTDRANNLQLVGALMDISARKKAEEALNYSERRFQRLFQAMAASFWELDFSQVNALLRGLHDSGVTDFRRYFDDNPHFIREIIRATRIVDVNDQTVALFGRGNKQELLENAEPFWPEESLPAYAEGVLSAISGQQIFSRETRMRRLDGSLVDVLFTACSSPEDRMRGTVLVGLIDITARKQAFAALEKSEQRYRSLFHHMPIALWQLDTRPLIEIFRKLRAEGVTDLGNYFQEHPEFLAVTMDAVLVQEVNERTVQLFGGRQASDFVGSVARYWQDRPDTFRRAMEARFRGEPHFEEETSVRTPDGRSLDVLFTTARPGPINELGISLVGLIDISQRVRTQAMLQSLQADFAHAARISTLGELTASIAHELNQPLAAILASGEASQRWLNRPKPDLAEVAASTERMLADARRAADIISRIRGMATRGSLEHSPVVLDEIVREALIFLRHEVQARVITVSHRTASAAPKVLADRTQLQQVIVNLAVNAMQAMEHLNGSQRRITLRTSVPDPETVQFTIEDSGRGIDGAHLTRLFDGFFTTKEGGMGIGLTICRSIVEAHGGRIMADNRSAHGGARFSFTLPAARAN